MEIRIICLELTTNELFDVYEAIINSIELKKRERVVTNVLDSIFEEKKHLKGFIPHEKEKEINLQLGRLRLLKQRIKKLFKQNLDKGGK